MVDTYRLCVRGHLEDRWSEWLGGLAVQRQEDGTTFLVGPVIDQAALYGVIVRIRDLGIPLISVNRVRDEHCSSGQEIPMGVAMPPHGAWPKENNPWLRRRRVGG